MSVIGILAALTSLTLIFVGFPKQVLKNWKRKSTEGVDVTLVSTCFLTYTMWSIYGWVTPDKFLAYSQTPGAALCVILLVQHWKYRKQRTV